jgi:hypothetical protein
MSIIKAIKQSFLDKERKGFDRLYYFFDIHGTILKPNYQFGNISKEFYPYAKETLQFLSTLPDVVMCIYTCSRPNEIDEYMVLFKSLGINFVYINENPEVKTQKGGYGCYDKKPYMNVLFEDKSGFSGEEDWLPVLNLLKEKYPQFNK